MKETINKLFNQISDTIQVFEAQRDYTDEGLTEKEQQFYNILNFCSDLLALTEMNKETLHSHKFAGETIEGYSLPIVRSSLTEEVFKLATNKGDIDLRAFLKHFITTQQEIYNNVGIRPATLSDYLNSKSSLNCDTYEKIINSRQQ